MVCLSILCPVVTGLAPGHRTNAQLLKGAIEVLNFVLGGILKYFNVRNKFHDTIVERCAMVAAGQRMFIARELGDESSL